MPNFIALTITPYKSEADIINLYSIIICVLINKFHF